MIVGITDVDVLAQIIRRVDGSNKLGAGALAEAILSALEPQDAPAVAGVEIPAGYTPGPWWTDARYDGREMGCPIIAARTDAGPLPGNPTRGMVAFASALLNTDARRCEANARLIALAPAMAEELVALRAEVARLREALTFYANPEVYRPHPHGPAFDRRDLSHAARAEGGRDNG